jgi:anti-sigma factor ChrR (cupin superfamily)
MTKHDIAELLPFYANGTLDAAERVRVETELATCAECSAELRELEGLGASLKAHAATAGPLPAHILDDALARISAAVPPVAVTKLRTAWWGGPARYATAAALVVGFGAAAVAAYHAHESDLARTTHGTGSDQVASTTVFRMTEAPKAAMRISKNANRVAAGAPAQLAPQSAADAAATVAKQHRLAKKAHIDLLVRDVEASLKAVQSIVRGAGGEIVSLADSNPRTADAVHDAKLDVEVPADRLESTLDRIGTAGTVQNRAIEAEDVDATIVDEEARLRNLRRAETDLRTLMDKGGKVSEILTVQESLNEVRGQIEQLEAQHKNDVHRVATSTISIQIAEDRPNPTPVKSGPGARIDGAWHSGLNALADTVVALLSTIAWCVAYAPIPLALAGITYAAIRLLRRGAVSA